MKDRWGKLHLIRFVVDSGSQLSFITSRCANRFCLNVKCKPVTLSGFGNSTISTSKEYAFCENYPVDSKRICLSTKAAVLSQITSDLSTVPLNCDVTKGLPNDSLADPEYFTTAPIDFLLDADLFSSILLNQQVITLDSGPSAIPTVFGLLLMGNVRYDLSPTSAQSLFSCSPSIDETLRKFWEIEEPAETTAVDPEEEEVELQFKRTHYRTTEGRYVVSLPFRFPADFCAGSFKAGALKRLSHLERRLDLNPLVKSSYVSFMKDYEHLGHMKLADQPASYIIPHHCVTSRFRVVFDASAKFLSPSGQFLSLNDALLPGPKLQQDLCDILLNFRLFSVAFTADICKIYRQILVEPNDCRYQHILWRSSPNSAICEYELTTVTYGVTSAPFFAMRVLQQLVHDEGSSYPKASHLLLHNTYVDDIVAGAASLAEAITQRNQLVELLSKARFFLKKWCNFSQFMSLVPKMIEQLYSIILGI